MFPDPSLDDVRDVLQGRREVLQPIMAESSVVGEVRVVPMLDIAILLCYLHGDNSIEQLSSVAPDHLLGRAKLRQRLAVPEKFSVDHQFCFFSTFKSQLQFHLQMHTNHSFLSTMYSLQRKCTCELFAHHLD